MNDQQPTPPTINATPTNQPTPMPAPNGNMPPNPTFQGTPGTPPKSSNTGLIIGIIAIVTTVIVLTLVALFAILPTLLGTADGFINTDTVQDLVTDLYDDLDRVTTDNYVAGIWHCAPGTGSSTDYDNFNSTLELNTDLTFRYGQYGDLANNHYSGTYTFRDEDKSTPSDDYNYYMVDFVADEFMVDGELQDLSQGGLSQLEMGITRTSEGKSAITIFVTSYNMYYCYAE